MFTSKKTVETSSVDTIIGSSASIEGNISLENSIRIDGKLIGDINCKSSVSVGEKGYVKGDIFAENVSVSGIVEGCIKCSGLLEISAGGKLVGDVDVSSISIGDGALFRGNCCMEVHNTAVNENSSESSDTEEAHTK
jgi:cytoskeletal protein CcmA (bactofilin family)